MRTTNAQKRFQSRQAYITTERRNRRKDITNSDGEEAKLLWYLMTRSQAGSMSHSPVSGATTVADRSLADEESAARLLSDDQLPADSGSSPSRYVRIVVDWIVHAPGADEPHRDVDFHCPTRFSAFLCEERWDLNVLLKQNAINRDVIHYSRHPHTCCTVRPRVHIYLASHTFSLISWC